MEFTETDSAKANVEPADRHSSAPVADKCVTRQFCRSATQQEPSVEFTEMEPG